MMHTVIGGGLAGLTAAVSLARRGARVRLMEHSDHLGGRAITNSIDGFMLNLGPHALYRKGHAFQTLANWGINPKGRQPDVGPRSFFAYLGRLYPLLKSPKDLLFSELFSIGEKLDAGNALRKLTAKPQPALSLSNWLDAEVHTAKVRLLIEALVRVSTYVNEPSRMRADAALRQVQLAIEGGVLYLDGGWQQLVSSLEASALQAGVTIEKNARTDGLEPGAILAVPPQQVASLTGVAFPQLHPVPMACLDLGLSELPPKAAVFALGMDQPFYFSVHTNWATLASGSRAVVHIGKYLGSSSGADVRPELESFADLAMPGWRERVIVDRFLPEMTVTHTGPWVGGSRPEVDEIPGVLLAGDWVGADGMLSDTAFASGVHAADLAWRNNERKAA